MNTKITTNWQLIRDGKIDVDAFVKRAKILDLIREWFRKEGFLEVETPLMVRHPGMEPHLNLFSSEFISEDGKMREKRYLHTSPEYSMKKLLSAGFEKIFQVTKVFRNAELGGGRHSPEFTLLEWYRADADYYDIMDDTERMVKFVIHGLESIVDGKTLNPRLSTIDQEWEKLSVKEAFQQYAGLNLDELREFEQLKSAVEQKKYSLNTEYSWDDLFFLIMLNEVEPHLGKERPTFLYDYPASQAALAKRKECTCGAGGEISPCKGLGVGGCSFWAERFELYIDGVELCNAFSELTDPVEQRQRLEKERELRRKLGKDVYDLDEDFLEALETMPPSGGNALGIDRLVMVLMGKKSLKDVLLFPWEDI